MHMHISIFLKSYIFDYICTYTYTCIYIYIYIYIYIHIYLPSSELLRSAGHRVLINHVSFNHKQTENPLHNGKEPYIHIDCRTPPPGGFSFLACFGVKKKRTRTPSENTTHMITYISYVDKRTLFMSLKSPMYT